MSDEQKKPILREGLTVTYEADGRTEPVIVKRLTNTDMVKWARFGGDETFLVLRSVEFADNQKRADPAWFDSLSQESAIEVVELALNLNNAPTQKKILAAIKANLESWLSAMGSSSSAAAAIPSTTTPTTN